MKTELKEYILEKRQVLGAAALGLLISSGVLFLYQLPLEAVVQCASCMFCGSTLAVYRFWKIPEKTKAVKTACRRAEEGFFHSGSSGE
ncbi:MAG: hypothetical protein ACLS5R_02240 [Blautia sp.]